MAEIDIKANKILSVTKPILEAILKYSGKDIPWGQAGIVQRDQVEQHLADASSNLGQKLRSFYTILSNLRNQAPAYIKWGKGDIPELEYMDSTLAGLYSFISEYVLKFEIEEDED